ncbi:cysteine-rich motor neuron 1 protein-like [Pleurodeles waltl]|uniref:cysteine-rich motor neuron 1 protein-like n=1 Tax=Pleurodeles waltl TaxID=8319 RepID=UPI0037094A56
MNSRVFLCFFLSCLFKDSLASNCTACDRKLCPPSPLSCSGKYATDPCGCCRHCAKEEWQPCGGENWQLGYCDHRLRCAALNGTQLVQIPDVGVCKRLPAYLQVEEDENCPEVTGCNIKMSVCVCGQLRSCFHVFSYPNINICRKHTIYQQDRFDSNNECWDRGCNIIEGQCVCRSRTCGVKYQFWDQIECNAALVKVKCANVTCPAIAHPTCPWDSVATMTHTPAGHCCPTIPSFCTCNFHDCPKGCSENSTKEMIERGTGIPGNCCDQFKCIKDAKSGRGRENSIVRRRRLHPFFSHLEKTNRARMKESRS